MSEFVTVNDFDFHLPTELIAQYPNEKRDASRMMVLDKKNGKVQNSEFKNFIDYLNKDDVLVLNNTKVIPARLLGKKETGANIEIFLLHPLNNNNLWSALIKNAKRLKNNDIVKISDELQIKIISKGAGENGCTPEHTVEILCDTENIYNMLEKYGKIPLPPYISREAQEKDKQTYQTVFAQIPGSVAAPTAGLHFTEEVLDKIKNKGVKIAYITLDVGLGTFLPVQGDDIQKHKMHRETYEITKENADIINTARGSIIAVGTTVARTLEATYKKYNEILPIKDSTDIFIYPPYKFNVVDKLLTNFHLPKSTLIMLVSALSNKDYVLNAYKKAVDDKYRFFSYGDCMFVI